jgi:hypothetical protein
MREVGGGGGASFPEKRNRLRRQIFLDDMEASDLHEPEPCPDILRRRRAALAAGSASFWGSIREITH